MTSESSFSSSFERTIKRICATEPFARTISDIDDGERHLALHGLAGSLDGILLSHLRRSCDRQMLVVTPTTDAAEEIRDDLETLLGEAAVCYFPDWEVVPFEEKSPHVEVTGLRLEALQKLLLGDPLVVVTSVAAIMHPTLEPEALAAASRIIRVGDLVDLNELAGWMRALSFEPENKVEQIGQYARRGGIIDVYTFGAENPYRIELFDDEVESIREFDPATQRSTGSVEEIEILPRREILSGADWWADAPDRIDEAAERTGQDLSTIREQVSLGIHFAGIEFWSTVLSGVRPSLLDHLDNRAIVYLADKDAVEERAKRFYKDMSGIIDRRQERGQPVLPIEDVLHAWNDLERQINDRVRLDHVELSLGDECIEFGGRTVRRYEGSLEALAQDMDAVAHGKGTTLVLAENEAQAARLEDVLGTSFDRCDIDVGRTSTGFFYPAAGVQVVNDHELFSRQKRRHRYKRYHGSAAIKDAFSLTPGDVVIHEDHGIGVYQGIERIAIDGVARDTVKILYRDKDKLYVPAEEIDRVQRFSKDEENAPVLSKLGGADWERLKAKTKKGAVKLAKDLIKLYATRQANPGFSYSEDGHWMNEMEAAFIYEETRDQLTAIRDIKADMEKEQPTDRLVCGDVGYGKTEVAIRAAFKAVVDQKQVAVLVPTTILAQQHYHTFKERLSGFPVRVDVLSRFRTKKEIETALHDVERGQVDILIGTHRILSQDVKFKDLGLIVIDEEQRFGVKHKERLKHLRQTVDVVSMTATPIPRTLHLSLMGARDMSVINTPPKDRLPVHTEVIPFDEDKVAEGILREIDRSGQVFFLHNRVHSIEERAEWLKDLLPDVRFRIAHGQMSERQLEKVMLDFIDHKFDVLITTMIIQSGVDIPNANTIFVDRADMFGLAELYQLRGRVGRSNHRAYAYLLVPPETMLNPKARKRLRAIEEHSDLGSGFRVAMRDLEIRGAGNLLGNEQHGFIAAVGFDLYVKLLDEAIREMNGEVVESVPDCEVDIRLSSFLPDDYVADGEQKMELYRRLSAAASLDETRDFEHELKDRYGFPPEPARSLIAMMRMKILGKTMRAGKISVDRRGVVTIRFAQANAPRQDTLAEMVGRSVLPIDFRLDGDMYMTMDVKTPPGLEQAQRVIETLEILTDGISFARSEEQTLPEGVEVV